MTGLDHIGVYVRDIERSLSFYTEVFGFPLKERRTSGEAQIALLDIGGGLLELVQRPGSPGAPPAGNWSHVALKVDDFDAMVETLGGMNVEMRLRIMPDNRLCFFSDPDGHVVELMEKGFS